MINIFSIRQFHPWKDVLQSDEPRDQNTTKCAFQTECKGFLIIYSVVFNYQKFLISENDEGNSIELADLGPSASEIVDDQGNCETSGNNI